MDAAAELPKGPDPEFGLSLVTQLASYFSILVTANTRNTAKSPNKNDSVSNL